MKQKYKVAGIVAILLSGSPLFALAGSEGGDGPGSSSQKTSLFTCRNAVVNAALEEASRSVADNDRSSQKTLLLAFADTRAKALDKGLARGLANGIDQQDPEWVAVTETNDALFSAAEKLCLELFKITRSKN